MQRLLYSPIPSQKFTVELSASQSLTVTLETRSTGVYCTLSLGGTVIISGQLVHDRSYIIRQPYLRFPGNLFFVDTQGSSDPDLTNPDRFWLVYDPDAVAD